MTNVSESTKNDFKAVLQQSRRLNSSDPIANCYPWQTKLATLELLDMAAREKRDIKILTGTATEQFYAKDVSGALAKCLMAGCSARVLIGNDDTCQASRELLSLRTEYPSQVDIRISGTCEDREKLPHFLLVGSMAFRLEAPHPYMDPATTKIDDLSPPTKARICFNDPKLGELLGSFFDSVWPPSPVGCQQRK